MSCTVGGRPAVHAPREVSRESSSLWRALTKPKEYHGICYLLKFETALIDDYCLYVFYHDCSDSDDADCTIASKIRVGMLDDGTREAVLFPIVSCFMRFLEATEQKFTTDDVVFSLAHARDGEGKAQARGLPKATWFNPHVRPMEQTIRYDTSGSVRSAEAYFEPYVQLVDELSSVLCSSFANDAKLSCIDDRLAFRVFDFVLCRRVYPDVDVPRGNVFSFHAGLDSYISHEVQRKLDADAVVAIIQSELNTARRTSKNAKRIENMEKDLEYATSLSETHKRLLSLLLDNTKPVEKRTKAFGKETGAGGSDDDRYKSSSAKERAFSLQYQTIHRAQRVLDAVSSPDAQLLRASKLTALILSAAESCTTRVSAKKARADKEFKAEVRSLLHSLGSVAMGVVKADERERAKAAREAVRSALEDFADVLNSI